MAVDYGTDLSCVDDLDDTMREVSGNRLMLEAIARRITTDRASAIDAPNDGINLADYINETVTAKELSLLPGIIRAEIQKDERVLKAPVSQSYDFAAKKLTETIEGEGANGPFRLVIAVSEADVEILEAV